MDNVTQLVKDIREGKIDPGKAVEKFERPAVHISEVPIDNLKVDVLDCGFPTLNDYMVFKRNRGELVVLGARPSMGKSAFLFQIATHVAKTDNILISSLEMDKESIKARMLAANTGFGLQKIFRGEVPYAKLHAANKELDSLKYHIDDRSGLDIKTLTQSAIEFHKKTPISLMIVDYLQLVKSGNRASRNEEVGDVSMELKQLAKQLRCPILVAAQLNRKCIERGNALMARGKTPDYKPELGDLRESGNIEQDADGVLFLSRHEVYSPGFRTGQADIGIAKQRNGPTGWETFRWLGASTRFVDPKAEGNGI
jgi:replicative DNA helicase